MAANTDATLYIILGGFNLETQLNHESPRKVIMHLAHSEMRSSPIR